MDAADIILERVGIIRRATRFAGNLIFETCERRPMTRQWIAMVCKVCKMLDNLEIKIIVVP